MALTTTGQGRGVGCRGCAGRGWRVALRRRRELARDVVRSVRRVCPDCFGGVGAVVERASDSAA